MDDIFKHVLLYLVPMPRYLTVNVSDKAFNATLTAQYTKAFLLASVSRCSSAVHFGRLVTLHTGIAVQVSHCQRFFKAYIET